MLSPVIWLVVTLGAERPRSSSTGAYDLLHPTLHGVQGHVGDDRLRALLPQQPDHLHRRRRCWRRRSRRSAGYALARFRFRGSRALSLTVIGTQLIPGSMFLLPVFIGFIWLKQNRRSRSTTPTSG